MVPESVASLVFRLVQRGVHEAAILRRTEVLRTTRARIGQAEPRKRQGNGDMIALRPNGWVSARAHGAKGHRGFAGAIYDRFCASSERIAPAAMT